MNDSLYREQLMEYYKDPQHRGTLANPDVSVYEKNPFCGDEITLQLSVTDGVVEDAKFSGSACAVSIASSEIVTEEIIGKNIEDAEKITKEDILEMLGVELTTSRVKCATLVLEALQKAIEYYKENMDNKIEFEEIEVTLPITKDTNLGMLVAKYPDVAEVLLDYGLHCVGCIANSFDTLEAGASIHGYSSEEIDELVTRVNEVISYGE